MKEVYFESSGEEEGYFLFLEKLFEKKSKYQSIYVGKNNTLGKCLILDGVVQFSEKDEFIYHEALVQPAMHILNGAKSALILGGGDGMAAREFLKHEDIKKVVVVDIDEEVTNISKEYFSDLIHGTFEDPRAELNIGNALEYVKNTKEKFDIIIMDLTDPGQPIGATFYSDNFFKMCKRIMNEKSIFVTHGSCFTLSFPTAPRVFLDFKKSFKDSKLYRSDFIDSYDITMGFMLGYDSDFEIDFEKIKERYSKIKNKLKYYSPEVHKRMFILSKWVKRMMEKLEPLPKGYTEVNDSAFIPLDKFPLKKK